MDVPALFAVIVGWFHGLFHSVSHTLCSLVSPVRGRQLGFISTSLQVGEGEIWGEDSLLVNENVVREAKLEDEEGFHGLQSFFSFEGTL